MSARLPANVSRLIDALARLPGVGQKTAARLAFFLIRSPDAISAELGEAATELKQNLKLCQKCRNVSDTEICEICSDPERDESQICVVESPLDVFAFEEAGVFRGQYHVLHGVLNPLEGVTAEQLTIADLLRRIEADTPTELIFAMNPSAEGESTAAWLTTELTGKDVRITRIARGLPTGSELTYADEITLRSSFEGRREY